MDLQDELRRLKSELAQLRNIQAERQQDYLQRLDSFSEKIDNLSQLVQVPQVEPSDQQQITSNAEKVVVRQANTIDELGIKVENGELVFKAKSENSTSFELDNQAIKNTSKNSKNEKNKNEEDWNSNNGANEFSSGFVSQVTEQFSELILAPFTPLLSKAKSFYTHYQQRGLAAVFLMTIAGIITMTLGFTYLLQYSFNNWLPDIGKVLFSFTAGNSILALGVYIYKRRAQMQDFASGLVGLGLIINYVSAYFSGPYFQIVPDWLSLLLLLFISLLGFFLSFKFETKVVAILSLLGGSLAPIMLFDGASNQFIYLPYLLLMGCCAIVQSRLLRWPLLTELTAVLHIICVELFIVSQVAYFEQFSIKTVMALLSINLMFYLYGFSGLYWLQKAKKLVLNTRLLVLPIMLFAFTLVSISQLSMYSGYIFLFNAVLLITAYLAVKSQAELKVLTLFLAGSFAGFAALQLLDQSMLGLVLFIEGIALLYLGCKGLYQSIRFEAYALLFLGLISHVLSLAEMLNLSSKALGQVSEFGFVLLYLVLSALTFYVASRLLKTLIIAEKVSAFEDKIFTLLRECLSLNYVCLMLYIAAIISVEHTLNIIPLISLLLLYLAQKEQLKFSEFIAWFMLLPLVGAVTLGIIDVGSARFSEQPLYAQLARIELFTCFIGFYYWYKRFYQQSAFFKFARFLQVLCLFVLPLLMLPKILRLYPDFLSLALWGSCLISLSLVYFSRHRLLIFEAKCLTVVAIIATATSCFYELWQGLLALLIGALLLAFLHKRYASLPALLKLLLNTQWLLTPYYFALVMVVAVHTLMSLIGLPNWGVIMAVLVIYFTQLLNIKPMPLVLRKTYPSSLLLLVFPSFFTLLLHFDNGLNLNINSLLFMFAQVFILATLWLFYKTNASALRILTKTVPRLSLQWTWHVLLMLSYLLWSYQFSHFIAAPLSIILLVVHGSSLMFVSLKAGQQNTIKLASMLFVIACAKMIFIDMVNFLIIQKVIAFMLIGGILLAVSYFYQKMKNQSQIQIELEES